MYNTNYNNEKDKFVRRKRWNMSCRPSIQPQIVRVSRKVVLW